MVLAHDLLEDRRTIDVIVTGISPPCFKMAESFENLDNILRDWAKDKGQKKSARKAGRGKLKPLLLKKMARKSSQAVSVGSRAKLNQTQNWSWSS